MSIKPVDVGVMVQRMNEVDRVQQVRDQRAATAQQQFGLEMKAELERRETEVKAPPEAAKLAVNPDAKRERRQNPREEAPSQNQTDQAEPSREGGEAPGRGSSGPGQKLDITL